MSPKTPSTWFSLHSLLQTGADTKKIRLWFLTEQVKLHNVHLEIRRKLSLYLKIIHMVLPGTMYHLYKIKKTPSDPMTDSCSDPRAGLYSRTFNQQEINSLSSPLRYLTVLSTLHISDSTEYSDLVNKRDKRYLSGVYFQSQFEWMQIHRCLQLQCV